MLTATERAELELLAEVEEIEVRYWAPGQDSFLSVLARADAATVSRYLRRVADWIDQCAATGSITRRIIYPPGWTRRVN